MEGLRVSDKKIKDTTKNQMGISELKNTVTKTTTKPHWMAQQWNVHDGRVNELEDQCKVSMQNEKGKKNDWGKNCLNQYILQQANG